jgi:organic radical activating enzyme
MDKLKKYLINEVFYALQGEGVRAGIPHVFVRFTACNLRCAKEAGDKSPGGFDCDTEFESGRGLSFDELRDWIERCHARGTGRQDVRGAWIVLTGGEPALQLDAEFCGRLHDAGFSLAIETNGSIELPRRTVEISTDGSRQDDGLPLAERLAGYDIDWITVSPKVAEHAVRQRVAHEVKYVRAYGQAIPKTVVEAFHYVISPAFDGDYLDPETLAWCKDLVKQNPRWRLSVQQHKGWRER